MMEFNRSSFRLSRILIVEDDALNDNIVEYISKSTIDAPI